MSLYCKVFICIIQYCIVNIVFFDKISILSIYVTGKIQILNGQNLSWSSQHQPKPNKKGKKASNLLIGNFLEVVHAPKILIIFM